MALPLIERVLFLKGAELFSQLPSEDLMPLAQRAQEVHFKAGETFIHQDEPGSCLYVIVDGEASIVARDMGQIGRRGPKGAIGEMAIIWRRPRSADCVALTDITALKIEYVDFWQLMEERPTLALGVITLLARRLDETTDSLQRLRHEEEKRIRELERTRAFEAFLGGLAHAIRNPLSAVTGPIANLKRIIEGSVLAGDDRVASYMRYAEEGVARIAKTLADAELVLSRPELKRRPLSVQEVVEELVRKNPAAGVELAAKVDPRTRAMGDETAARRVLENLVSSAAAALRGSGKVLITARPVENAASCPAAEIIVSYPGIPPDAGTAARMFEPFLTAKPGESAIGLYAAKELAMRMGWEITAGAAPEGGIGLVIRAPSV